MSTSPENPEFVHRLSVSENSDGGDANQIAPCASEDLSGEANAISLQSSSMADQDKQIMHEPSSTTLQIDRYKSQDIHKQSTNMAPGVQIRKSSSKKSPARKANSNSKRSTNQGGLKLKLASGTATKAGSSSFDSPDDADEKEDNSHDEIKTPCADSVSAFLYTEDFEDNQTAILAAQMGQNTFGYMGALPVHGGQVSPERSKVIHEILKNFDLEQVMSRYRGSTMYTKYRHGSKNAHFRSSLEEIMGRERAHFDDQRWNDRLMRKVMADLERRLDENERELEEAENQRILKLKLMGVYQKDGCEEGEKRRHVHKPHKKTTAERKLEKRNKMARESLFRPSEDIVTQMEILHRDETQVKRRSTSSSISDINSNNNQTSEEIQDSPNGVDGEVKDERDCSQGHTHDSEEEARDSSSPGKGERNHVTHQQLTKLFQEEDLRELYKEAENLVRLSGAPKK